LLNFWEYAGFGVNAFIFLLVLSSCTCFINLWLREGRGIIFDDFVMVFVSLIGQGLSLP
jgi:hypothetical protein